MLHTAEKNRIDQWLEAGSHRDAAHALLALIAAEPQCLPAYQKLGVAYLRLREFREAERYLLHAAEMMPGDPGAFDGLAETFGHLGDASMARSFGRRALVLKDAGVPFLMQRLRSAPPRPGGARLIAFCLFGADPRYCETAVSNAEAAPGLMPGWTCRFYVDATVPPPVLVRLQALSAQIVTVEGACHALPKTMWRFLALDDADAEAVVCRDADSLLNERDAGWIGEWMQSGRAFHIIRDYFSHTELILAGLFGVRGGVLEDIQQSMRQWVSGSGPAGRWTDQNFLRNRIWPLARDAALTHDPWFGYGSDVAAGTWIGDDVTDHVGANNSTTTMVLTLDQPDGCLVRWALVDAAGQTMCSYEGKVYERQLVVAIPRGHSARIRGGALQVRWTKADDADGATGGIIPLAE